MYDKFLWTDSGTYLNPIYVVAVTEEYNEITQAGVIHLDDIRGQKHTQTYNVDKEQFEVEKYLTRSNLNSSIVSLEQISEIYRAGGQRS